MLRKKTGITRRSHLFGSWIQMDCTLFCARFAGLEIRRVEWCKPSDDQSVVIQTTNPNHSALWRVIALLRWGWSRWIIFRRVPCLWEEGARGWG